MGLIYQFDWDISKEVSNIRKHKINFRQASTIFRDPNHISIYDDEHSLDEERWITIGIDSSGVLRVVIHTYKMLSDDIYEIRIISARKATSVESNQYHEGI